MFCLSQQYYRSNSRSAKSKTKLLVISILGKKDFLQVSYRHAPNDMCLSSAATVDIPCKFVPFFRVCTVRTCSDANW